MASTRDEISRKVIAIAVCDLRQESLLMVTALSIGDTAEMRAGVERINGLMAILDECLPIALCTTCEEIAKAGSPDGVVCVRHNP